MNFKESLQGVVKNVRKVRIESKGGICLDKDCILYCDRPVEGLLELHITKGLTRTVVMEAKQKLLQTVKGDPTIKTISAVSPFVEEHQDFMQKFGFEIDESLTPEVREEIAAGFPENMRGKPFIQMRVSREKFLEINDKPTSDN